jgi:hypothetical protein
MPTSVYVEALTRAAKILGGPHQLRAYLRVSIRELEAWMRGAQQPPVHVFLKVVDVISAETSASLSDPVRQSRELRAKAERKSLAAQAARGKAADATKRAAAVQERAVRLRAALLENGAAGVARRPRMSVDDFVAADFGLSESAVILEAALNAAVNGTGAPRVNVQLTCPEGLRLVTHIGFEQPFLEFFATVGRDTPACCGAAHESAQRVIVRDVRTDPIFAGTLAGDVMQSASARACQSTPLTGSAGEVIGMISTHYEKPHRPSPEELATIDLIAQRTSYWLGGHGL